MSAVQAETISREIFSPPQELEFRLLALDLIDPSPYQTRASFDEAELLELGENIRANGLLEPLVVRPADPNTGRHQLIAGERRLRGMRLVGILNAAVTVRDVDDRVAQSLVLIENLHRKNLDPVEEATGYRSLAELGMTQTEIGQAINRSQPAIANALRLLELPEDVLQKIRAGHLSAAHARALVKYAPWPKLCNAIAEQVRAKGLTSKQLEKGFGYDAIDSYDLERKKLLATVQTDLPADDLKQAGITVFKRDIYSGGLTPDVESFTKAEKQIRKQQGERQKQAQQDFKEGRKAGTLKGELIQLKDINRDQYRSWAYGEPPAGCTTDCPCRARGAPEYGGETDICVYPKRYDGLRKAEEKSKNDAIRARMHGYVEQTEAVIGGLGLDSPKAIALLAFYVLCEADKPRRAAAWKAFVGTGLSLPEDASWNRWDPDLRTLQVLEQVEPAALIRAAVSSVVRKQLHERFQGFYSNTGVTRWLTGVTVPEREDDRWTPDDSEGPIDIDSARAMLAETLIDWEVLEGRAGVLDHQLVDIARQLLKEQELDEETTAEIQLWADAIEATLIKPKAQAAPDDDLARARLTGIEQEIEARKAASAHVEVCVIAHRYALLPEGVETEDIEQLLEICDSLRMDSTVSEEDRDRLDELANALAQYPDPDAIEEAV